MRTGLERKLQERLEWLKATFEEFPFECCGNATRELYRAFGYSMIGGIYSGRFSDEYLKRLTTLLGYLPEDFKGVPHDFSFDSETGLFIDLTARQFHDSNPEILLIEANDPRVALSLDDITPLTTHLVRENYTLNERIGKP